MRAGDDNGDSPDWSRNNCGTGSVRRSWSMGLGLGISGDTVVLDVSDVAGGVIEDRVGDDLGKRKRGILE